MNAKKAEKERLASLDARRRLGDESVVLKREIHARKMLARARRRSRLANTVVIRWQKVVRYYERKGK